MPSAGPSKEDLQNYWNTSRQYFDELAAFYKTSDPAYYNDYIAPFYRNPLNVVSGRKGPGAGKIFFVLSLALIILGLTAGVAVFLLMGNNDDERESPPSKYEKNIEQQENSNQKTRKIGEESDSVKVPNSVKTPEPEKEIDPSKYFNRKQPIKRVR